MDAPDVVATCGWKKKPADIPVIIFSATTTESIVEKAITLGANAVCSKTRFSIAELREMVKEYVSKTLAKRRDRPNSRLASGVLNLS